MTVQVSERTPKLSAKARPVIAWAMIVVWPLVPISAFVAHAVRRSDNITTADLPPLTELHVWLGIVAVAITVIHLLVDRRIVTAQLRRLVGG